MTAEEIIDQCFEYLHDNASIWKRAELLRWLNDGYGSILCESKSVVRPFQHDIPGRTTFAASQEWEDRHAKGLFRRFTLQVANGHLAATYQWETEFLAGIEPTDSVDAVTQLWERCYTDDVDEPFRFALAKTHERPLRAYWDDKSLAGISSKELDLNKSKWWNRTGEPLMWLQGSGREESFEVFEVPNEYIQSYHLQDANQGIPRLFTSDDDREYEAEGGTNYWDYSYSTSADAGMVKGLGYRFAQVALIDASLFAVHPWEKEVIDGGTQFTDSEDDGVGTNPEENPYPIVGLGLLRGIVSDDRQYLACAYDSGEQITGSARYFGSSVDAITLWEVVVPTRDLIETDELALVPAQLHKYLRFYTLGKAFARPGQGFRPDLADHFGQLYQLGVALLSSLGNPALIDRVYAREQVGRSGMIAPPRVRFPSTFERSY